MTEDRPCADKRRDLALSVDTESLLCRGGGNCLWTRTVTNVGGWVAHGSVLCSYKGGVTAQAGVKRDGILECVAVTYCCFFLLPFCLHWWFVLQPVAD